jgi:hypothetical protein
MKINPQTFFNLKGMGQDEFRFQRLCHRVFSKCRDLSAAKTSGMTTRHSTSWKPS